MTIKAVFFDLGGVIVRTEFQAPRQHLAERFNMDFDEMGQLVFESPTGRKAMVGEMTAHEHWMEVLKTLKQPEENFPAIRYEFFAGDIVDREIVSFLRSLKDTHKVGLISNAFDDLRPFVVSEKFDDAFHHMIISAEVGAAKPGAKIYEIALDHFQVQPDEAVFVDDFLENIEGCERMGMHGVHFKDPAEALDKVRFLLSRSVP